jgi:hypothetical protein
MIERNQASVLAGTASRAPANFENQDIVTRTIEANQMTVHSITAHSAFIDTNTLNTYPAQISLFAPYILYIREASWEWAAWLSIFVFLLLPSIRLGSGKLFYGFTVDVWLAVTIEGKFSRPLSIGIYGLFCGVILVGVILRGFGFSYAVLWKNISLHNRVLRVRN